VRRFAARAALALLALASAAALVAACRGCGGGSRGEALALRLIAGDPAEAYDPRQAGRAVAAFHWPLQQPRDLAGWRAAHLDLRHALHGGALRVRFARPDPAARPHLVRALDVDAAALDAVAVEASGPRRDFRNRGRLQLYWAGPGEDFAEERSLAVDAVQDMGAYSTTYTFPLAGHPRWAGRIAALRLDPTSAPDDTVHLHAVRGIDHEPAPERLAAALARDWKVELGDDLRPARVAAPGHPLQWTVDVPRAAKLRFAYGVSRGAAGPVRFALSLAGEGAPLFEDTVAPSAPHWREAAVDLASVAGRRVTLAFEATAAAAWDPTRTVAAWGHPELWQAAARGPAPNVIVVSLDTLRADRLSLYGNPRPTSPLLDAWARRRAVVFESAVAPSPWTLPSHASLFTGLDALRHGVNHGYPVPRALPIMADLFRRAGYATLGVTGGGYVGAEFGFDRGFDSYYSHRQRGDDSEMEAGVERALGWLRRRRDQPFFLFFHTYAVHAPYRPRQPHFDRLEPGRAGTAAAYAPRRLETTAADGFLVRQQLLKLEPGRDGTAAPPSDHALVGALYDSSVAYADAQLGRLLQELAALGLERRTVVVVTSDHGEALGERELAGHAYLYDFNLMVPLLVAAPDGRGAGRRVGAQVRSVDVLPTVLELAGLPAPPGLDGASLLGLMDGRADAAPREAWSYAASTNFGVSLRAPGVKYIYNDTAWAPACGRAELYHLSTDPREERDLAPGAGRAEADRLRERVQRTLATQASGLMVQIANAGPDRLAGTIEAPFLHQVRTKSPGPECGEVAWNAARGGIDFTAAAGRSYRLLLEGVGPGELRLALHGRGQRFEATLRPRELARPWQVAHGGSGWRVADAPGGAPATGVKVQWVGSVRVEESLPEQADPALRDRLRALGYVQ
jgi:arylsulfatase A-like enzyme